MKYLLLSPLILTMICATLTQAYGAKNQVEPNHTKPSTASPSQFMINSGHINQQNAMTKQITPKIKPQYIWLNADRKSFLIGLKEQYLQEDAKGAVIILHDNGQHLRWPFPLNVLYQQLPAHGWSVLSLQLAQFTQQSRQNNNNSNQQHAFLRQQLWLSIELLRSQGLHNIAMLAVGDYVNSAVHYLATQAQLRIYGLILLNPSTRANAHFFDIKKLKNLPILDIYTLQTHNPEANHAAQRRKAKSQQAGSLNYQQGFFLSEEYNFSRTEHMLANRIYTWLNTHVQPAFLEDGKIKAAAK
ncbi:hypothetical protein AVI51_13745 [Piscirickettsia salmonis]|uniref:Uncharacterized protein n=2 Tax=Piscirickettsia salmonis TaxID=1238 RepID=A0A9Q5VFT4_PISSA|nr:DUF3530 family protein [Piscirickettsia salmonis]WGZ70343.1 DUF3530 family protein [Piscirickettsia salmonis EM-90]ALA24087.1 phospholipase [Piscirickettsia salmonis]APS44488.1 hypothetical protein AVI48_09005 [Piscirickettsia salmonis]APS47849.1 hypothetical protein AVI49_09610 [Piscirickettsia salmonis]APS51806.1 hypothetical protein AVI50_13875 [Piscirickettsia salmonis]